MKKRTYEVSEFGKICRKIRIDAGIEQKEMARILKLNASTLCSYELGRNKIPYRLGPAIAKSFGLSETEQAHLEKVIREFNTERHARSMEQRRETFRKKVLEEHGITCQEKTKETTTDELLKNILEKLNNIENILQTKDKPRRRFF